MVEYIRDNQIKHVFEILHREHFLKLAILCEVI